MKMSDEPEICPYCGKEKTGQRTWSKALAPGTVLNNKILIGNILGKGGYGITYIGYDMLLEYRVAVKEFFPDEMVDRSDDEKTVVVLDEVNGEEYQKETAAYLREARILAEFSKFPGIVAIKDLFYENNITSNYPSEHEREIRELYKLYRYFSKRYKANEKEKNIDR